MLSVRSRQNHSNRVCHFLFSKMMPLFLPFACFMMVSACGGPPQYIEEGSESPAQLALTAESITQYSDLINGNVYTYSIQIENLSGTVPANNIVTTGTLSSPFAFTGGSFPGTGGDCGDTINPGSPCTLEFTVSPTATGDHSTSLSLNYFDGLADQTLSFDITASSREPIPAILSLSPTGTHDFGALAIGGFSDLVMTVTNSGELPASSVNFSGLSTPFSVINNACGTSVAAASSCQVTIRFAPVTDTVSLQTMTLSYNDGTSPQSLTKNFSGEGRIAGFLAIDEGLSFDYGIILAGFSSDRSLTLRNTGGGNASSINVSSLTAPFSVVSNSCPSTLVPAATCSLVVRYTPTATTSSNAILSLQYNDGFGLQSSLPNFAGQGFNNAVTVTMTNPASTPSNNDTPTFQIGELISGLTVRLYQTASCTIENSNAPSLGTTLDFSPTLAEGTYQFHARVQDSDGNLSSCSLASAPYEYDNSLPLPPSNVTFATSFTSSATASPTVQWSASPSGDVANYQVAIDSSPAGGNGEGGFTSKGNVTSAVESGLSLTECNYYYASVQAIDQVGLISATYAVSASSFRYDSAIPTTPSSLNEDGDGSTTNSATVTWSPSTDTCGISHYEVAIGEDTNANNSLDSSEIGNVIAFTNVGNITSHRFDAITLTDGVTHFTSVRAVDTTGRISNEAVSDPWIVFDPSIELPDMILWLDGNDPATIFDENGRDGFHPSFTGNVQDWEDKSGSTNTHHFDAVNGSSRPTFDGTNFTVDFDGANSVMTTPNHNEINTATVVQRNITVAFRTSGDIGSRQVLYEEGGNVRGMNVYIFNNRIYCGFYNDPGSTGGSDDPDVDQPFTWVSQILAPNTNYFVTWVFDYTAFPAPTGDLTCYLNGASIGSTTTTSRLFAHSGAVGLGAINGQSVFEDGSTPSSGSHFLGSIYEVMLFNNAPSTGDVTNVHTYLDNKWN